MQTDAFIPSLCRNHLSKPHARSLQHTKQSPQHSTGHPLVCARNKAEQGSLFFFLSHSGTASSSVEPILRTAGISSKYKQKRLISSSNQCRKLSSQQSRAIKTLHINPAEGQCYCQYDNSIVKEGLQCFLQLLLRSIICGSAKTLEKSSISARSLQPHSLKGLKRRKK